MRHLYSVLLYLALPFLLLRMLWRSRRAPDYRRRLAERFGLFPAQPPATGPVLWLHAVSVGETLAAAPLVEGLLRHYPDARLVVTTTTPTGSAQVRALFGERVFHVYCPWDLPGAVHRFLDRLRPDILVLVETELWPNLLYQCRALGCRVLLANARLSSRSARRYARVAGLARDMLAALDVAACQSAEDGERLVALGLPRERMRVTGSLKFDFQVGPELQRGAAQLRDSLGRPVLIAGSTHPGEESLVLDAFAAAREGVPELLCILVPRHPERFAEVRQLCLSRGLAVATRSSGEAVLDSHAVLLGDTMGELRLLYGAATLAVIGGSFVEHGGQNPLEAAAWGVPVVSGPSVYNFEQVSAQLVAAGAMLRLQGPGELAPCVVSLLGDADLRGAMGAAGRRVVEENSGACERLLREVGALLAR